MFSRHDALPIWMVPADGDGFVATRIYRKVPRGQHLDLFCLDMRSWRGPNGDTDPAVAHERVQAGLLGSEQEARSEEHTSELQSLMRNSYAVFCLKKKKKPSEQTINEDVT